MTPNEKAKLILLNDCKTCLNYREVDGAELCLVREWSGTTGFAVASNGKKYGVSAIPIFDKRTCDKWILKV